MKAALVVPRPKREQLFGPADLDQLSQLASLACNESAELNADVVAELAGDAQVLITSWGTPRLDECLLDQLPELRLVIYAAGSVKGAASPALWQRGIRITTGSEPLGRGVAETALGLTIASLKNVWRLAAEATRGGWSAERANVRELVDITIGVIGAGRAGSHYIRLLRPFDVDILLYDPFVSAAQAAASGATKAELDDLLRAADVVSVHAPSLPETYHLLDADRLNLLKDNAILINTARGSIIDEHALIAQLRAGRLFACLDVTDPEPPAPDNPLRSLPNCMLTGHVAGLANNGLRRLGRHAVAELRRYVAGEALTGEVRAETLSALA